MDTKVRRGKRLREHILWIAKDVFLRLGFERTSMDVIARRAHTSKRSLYAYFESKEVLFLAVLEMVRGLFLGRLRLPADYSQRPNEALVMFCARYLTALLYEPAVQMMRVSTAEAERFPEQARQYFDVLFAQPQLRLSDYLKTTFNISSRNSEDAANTLLGQILYPRLCRALFGVDSLAKGASQDLLPAELDLKPVRKAVAGLVERMQKLS